MTIDDIPVQVEVVDTPATRERGLSGRDSLAAGQGMLFVFEEEGSWGIWMKDMRFPIDIIWATSDGTVITVAPAVGPETYPQAFYPASATALYVLEVPVGFAQTEGIAEGSKIVVQ